MAENSPSTRILWKKTGEVNYRQLAGMDLEKKSVRSTRSSKSKKSARGKVNVQVHEDNEGKQEEQIGDSQE